MRRLCVLVDLERLLLMGDLNFEEVAVDYVCRHRGVGNVGVVDIGVVDIGVVDDGDVDVGVLLSSVSRSEVSLGF
jgi:hypothetical protein